MFVGQARQMLVPGYMYVSAGHTQALSDVEPAGDVVPAGQEIGTPPSQYLFGGHLQSVIVVALAPKTMKLDGQLTEDVEPGAAKLLEVPP